VVSSTEFGDSVFLKPMNRVKKIIYTPFLSIFAAIFLLSCNGKTPEEYDTAFVAEFNACVDRAISKCSNLDMNVCNQEAITRCETFLGTKENPVVK
tara:strand:+ start:904 stop:1191 length:288 start_codon:yes stop_codon:yes gene_type:complete